MLKVARRTQSQRIRAGCLVRGSFATALTGFLLTGRLVVGLGAAARCIHQARERCCCLHRIA